MIPAVVFPDITDHQKALVGAAKIAPLQEQFSKWFCTQCAEYFR